MKKTQVLKQIETAKIIPVIRTQTYAEAKNVIKDVLASGINILEITLTTPDAIKIIAEYAEEYENKVIVGAGTVVDAENARRCFEAGARFVVSPIFEKKTVRYCIQNNIVIMPGALTPTEIFKASDNGADAVKIFPVSAMGGASYIKAIKAIYPNIKIVPTGGVSLDNYKDYLKAGAFAVGIGSDLTRGKLPIGVGNSKK